MWVAKTNGWVAKACKLPRVKEKDLRTQDFKSKDPFLREHYVFQPKIKKSRNRNKFTHKQISAHTNTAKN